MYDRHTKETARLINICIARIKPRMDEKMKFL